MASLGLRLRPGWDTERFDRAVQAPTDGFLLQGRVRPDSRRQAWAHLDLYAESVVALTLGVLDTERSGRSARAALSSCANP